MLSLAVSAFVLGGVCLPDEQALSAEEASAWQKVQPTVAFINNGLKGNAVAVCIDAKGYFLAHRSAVVMPVISARLSSGMTVLLTPKSTDDVTQLTLLVTSGSTSGRFHPATPFKDSAKLATKLLAVLPSGPVRAEICGDGKIGIFSEKRRLLPLSEIRFEAPEPNVAGALVFTLSGELAGILNATLPNEQSNQKPTAPAANQGQNQIADTNNVASKAAAGGAGIGGGLNFRGGNRSYGPGILTVAYSAAPNVLQRVIDGFRSSSHRVIYPSLGIMCVDFPKGGAEIKSVQPNSAAAKAGMLAGDVMIELAGQKVVNQVDFARIMLDQTIGAPLSIRVLREGRETKLVGTVGAG